MGAEDSCGMLGAARTKERRRFFSPQDGAIQSLGKGKRSEGGCTEVGRLGICAQEAEGSGCWRPWVWEGGPMTRPELGDRRSLSFQRVENEGL